MVASCILGENLEQVCPLTERQRSRPDSCSNRGCPYTVVELIPHVAHAHVVLRLALCHKDRIADLLVCRKVFHLYSVSYTHLRAHETRHDLVCRLLLEKK